GHLSSRRGVSFDVNEWCYERDLKVDLVATQRGSTGQRRDLAECTRELLCCFDQCGALQGAVPSFAPPFHSCFAEARLGEMMRQQLRLGRTVADETVAQCLADATVKKLPPALKEILVGCILNECVLESIVR